MLVVPRGAVPVLRPEVPALFLPGEGEPRRLQRRPMRVRVAADPDPGPAYLDVEACKADNGVEGFVNSLRVGAALHVRCGRLHAAGAILERLIGGVNELHHFSAGRVMIRVIFQGGRAVRALDRLRGDRAGESENLGGIAELHGVPPLRKIVFLFFVPSPGPEGKKQKRGSLFP
jgi:hypothetical protein